MKLKQIKKLCDTWVYRLGLKWWEVTINYISDAQEIIKMFRIAEDEIVVARTFADWRYATCNIYFNLPTLKSLSVRDVEKVIIHELCHVLINEMREGGIDHEERVVTTLTKAFLWTEADCLSTGDKDVPNI